MTTSVLSRLKKKKKIPEDSVLNFRSSVDCSQLNTNHQSCITTKIGLYYKMNNEEKVSKSIIKKT